MNTLRQFFLRWQLQRYEQAAEMENRAFRQARANEIHYQALAQRVRSKIKTKLNSTLI